MTDTKSGFSADERAAMKQRAEELRTTKGLKGAAKLAKELEACTEAIDALDGVDGELARVVHRLVAEEAPQLRPRTFYGFPAYAADGKVIIFVQPASKFDTRFATVNYTEDAHLDDGDMWATSFAVVNVTDAVQQKIRALVKQSVAP